MGARLQGLRAARVLAAGLLAATAMAPGAHAHDSVVDSTPAANGVVEEFPREIVLEFSGEPKPHFNTLAISNADTKTVLFTGEPELNGRFVSIQVPADLEIVPGNYRIGFQITSSDGHSTRGFTEFTLAGESPAIAPATAAPDAAAPTDSQPDQSSQSPGSSARGWLGWALGAAVVAAAAATVYVVRSRRSG